MKALSTGRAKYFRNARQMRQFQKDLAALLASPPPVLRGTLQKKVAHILQKKQAILHMAKQHTTPFYLIDPDELNTAINEFAGAFAKHMPGAKHYYAMKVNHHPFIVKAAIKKGFGIDASSAREVSIALACGAKDILFTGPGKSQEDLEFALTHTNIITINIDSFGELEKLAEITKRRKRHVRAGVRIFTKYHGWWNKFGIPVADLARFWKQAQQYPYIRLEGIQVHVSFNENADPYRRIMEEIASHVKKRFSPAMRAEVRFIDIGGGFMHQGIDGYFPWSLQGGTIIKEASAWAGRTHEFPDRYYLTPAVSLEEYAKGIAEAAHELLDHLVQCAYYTEPGHIICTKAMHIVLRVADKKNDRHVIADGGTNIVGWEKYEYNYYPIVNLTHPSAKTELPCMIYGNLCMPDDLWGHYCYAERMEADDVLVVPYQGDMTYSLAQSFIHPIPPVYILRSRGTVPPMPI